MDSIHIIDDFLLKEELNFVLNFIETKFWAFGHISGHREPIVNTFFSTNILDEFFNKHIKEKIESYFSKKFKLNRNYMHIQTFGQDGGYHTDDEGVNKYTFCIYISDISDEFMENANGEFFIKIPNEKRILSIDTLMNRAVFFPSEYLHKGMAYNRLFSEKRLCITWKLESF